MFPFMEYKIKSKLLEISVKKNLKKSRSTLMYYVRNLFTSFH